MPDANGVSTYLGRVHTAAVPLAEDSWFVASVESIGERRPAGAEVYFHCLDVVPEERHLVVPGAEFYFMTNTGGEESITFIRPRP